MNKQKKNSSAAGSFHMTALQSGLVWFGAGVSIAEILTGTYLAPLGFRKGLAAILTGHLIGCLMMYFAGIIGGCTRRSAMELRPYWRNLLRPSEYPSARRVDSHHDLRWCRSHQ